jgi:hypothetical protein
MLKLALLTGVWNATEHLENLERDIHSKLRAACSLYKWDASRHISPSAFCTFDIHSGTWYGVA